MVGSITDQVGNVKELTISGDTDTDLRGVLHLILLPMTQPQELLSKELAIWNQTQKRLRLESGFR